MLSRGLNSERSASTPPPITNRPRPQKAKTLADLRLGKKFEIKKDEIRNLTFIEIAGSSEKLETRCYLYISDNGDAKPTLFIRCQYYGEDRFFFNRLMFRASDKTWTIQNASYQPMDHDRIDGKFFGSKDIAVSSGDNQNAIKAMLSDPKLTTIRLDSASQNTYEDFKVSPQQLDEMRSVFNVWADLKGI